MTPPEEARCGRCGHDKEIHHRHFNGACTLNLRTVWTSDGGADFIMGCECPAFVPPASEEGDK